MDNLSKNIFTTQNLVKQNDLVGDVTEEEIDFDYCWLCEVILGDQIHHHEDLDQCLVPLPPVKVSTAITPLGNHFKQYIHRCLVLHCWCWVGILEFCKIGIKDTKWFLWSLSVHGASEWYRSFFTKYHAFQSNSLWGISFQTS